jgi:NAD+ synthase (glutamine-hydrolysing)
MAVLDLALAQFAPRKGAYDANLKELGEWLGRAAAMDPRPQVIHLPETALSGYFLEGAVRDAARSAEELAGDLDRTYRDAVQAAGRALHTIDLVIGFYERWQDTLYNSAMYVTFGAADAAPAIRHVHRKVFLPTYSLFDEARFVEPGYEVRAFDTSWGRAAILICEDAWHSLTGTIAALDGAQVIFICAAAPARGVSPREDSVAGPATVARWDRLGRDMAEEHGVFVTITNLVGSEGGKFFSGASMAMGPGGDLRARGPLFEPALVPVTFDLTDIARVRSDISLLADLRTALPHLRNSLDRGPQAAPASAPSTAKAPATKNCIGRNAGGPPPLAIDPALLETWLVQFIRSEFARRGFAMALVGLSGGVDSSLTAILAAQALGPENVIGVRMPYRTSSPGSLTDAQSVIDALKIRSQTIDITQAVDGFLATDPKADAARRGNVMARMRMIVLFDLSAREHALALGTGNKSERLLGYFTWHADDSPPVNPLGDLFKTQVWALARHVGVPEAIITKPATADLITGQTDEGDIGITYGKADEILNWLIAGYAPAELVARGFDAGEVEIVRARLEGTHWKRRLPTVAMVSATAIGESYLRPVDY